MKLTKEELNGFWKCVDRSAGPKACWPWTRGKTSQGYGAYYFQNKFIYSHRLSLMIKLNKCLGKGRWALHKCDNPLCCNPKHLFEGNHLDNMRDMATKGRAASGDRNGARIWPESRARGDKHWSRLHPERLARGDKNGSRIHPDRMPRGDRNGSRTHPECLARGEKHSNAKFTDKQVLSIRKEFSKGKASYKMMAKKYGVSYYVMWDLIRRNTWKHI